MWEFHHKGVASLSRILQVLVLWVRVRSRRVERRHSRRRSLPRLALSLAQEGITSLTAQQPLCRPRAVTADSTDMARALRLTGSEPVSPKAAPRILRLMAADLSRTHTGRGPLFSSAAMSPPRSATPEFLSPRNLLSSLKMQSVAACRQTRVSARFARIGAAMKPRRREAPDGSALPRSPLAAVVGLAALLLVARALRRVNPTKG